MRMKILALVVGAMMCAMTFAGMASVPEMNIQGTAEICLSRVNPATDGTRCVLSGNICNGISYFWEQAEAFSPTVSVSTWGTNSKGIAIDSIGTWTYNTAYGQCSADAGSIWDAWTPGENAVQVYEVFNDQSTTGRNYTMIFEDQMDGDGVSSFGINSAQNALTVINDPTVAWASGSNSSCCLTIAAQTTGFEVATLFDGYGVYKSITPITQTNQGMFIGDATLTAGGYWQYIDMAASSAYYAVKVKWNGGTYPFYAPRYSYGMSNDVYSNFIEHWTAYAIGPVGSSSSLGPFNIQYSGGCTDGELYYSPTPIGPWILITTIAWGGFTTYSWTAPGYGSYYWMAVAGCGDNWQGYYPPPVGAAAEAGPYTIYPPTYEIPVVSGWNLISFPVTASGTPGAVLDDAGGDTAWSVVKFYDAQTPLDPWKTYRQGSATNDLSGLSNAKGFWIYITNPGSDGTLCVNGFSPGTTQIELKAGWNLVGYPSMTPDTVANVFWGTGADIVERFNSTQPTLIREIGPTDVMSPGNGYWVHVNSDSVWTVDW